MTTHVKYAVYLGVAACVLAVALVYIKCAYRESRTMDVCMVFPDGFRGFFVLHSLHPGASAGLATSRAVEIKNRITVIPDDAGMGYWHVLRAKTAGGKLIVTEREGGFSDNRCLRELSTTSDGYAYFLIGSRDEYNLFYRESSRIGFADPVKLLHALNEKIGVLE